MATTARNTTTKTAATRTNGKAINGHEQSVFDAKIKGEEHRARGHKEEAKPSATKPTEATQRSEATGTQYAYAAYCNSLGVQVTPAITYKNMIAGFIASICAMVVGYAVGMQIADWLAYGVFLLTGWAYLALAVWMVGAIITLIASIYAGGKVAAYIGTGAYTKDMERVGSWFKSKFTSTSDVIKRQMFNDNKAAA